MADPNVIVVPIKPHHHINLVMRLLEQSVDARVSDAMGEELTVLVGEHKITIPQPEHFDVETPTGTRNFQSFDELVSFLKPSA